MSVSPVSGAPARSRAATRGRILASARALFAERGLHDVTSHDIARGAGIASGTFYLHFKDKQSLFREIAFDAVERLKARLTEQTGDVAEADLPALRAAELLRFAEENRDLVHILFARGGASAVAEEVLEHLVDWVCDEVRGDETGEAAGLDPIVFAQARVGMWARVMTWWAESPERASRQTVIHTLVALQRTGPPL